MYTITGTHNTACKQWHVMEWMNGMKHECNGTHNNTKHTNVTASAAPEGEVHTPYLPVVQGCRVGHSERSVVFLQAVL